MDRFFDASQVNPWQQREVKPQPRPDFADDENLKKSFGIALGKDLNSFQAGLEVFPDQTAKALWISSNWVNDPIVIANRDGYKRALKKTEKPLDKEELLSEVLNAAKFASEDKDKASLFKLYAEIAGFIGKQAETVNNNFNNSNNTMKIVFVKPDAPKTIEASNSKSKILNEEELPPIKLKLVGGTSR